jgi:hypothetical protein
MKIYYIFFLSILCNCFFSCKEKTSYYLKDKWTTKALPYTVLKNSPKSVTEFTYKGADSSINKNPLKIFSSSESYSFNEDGDQTAYKLIERGEQYATTTRYGSDGYTVMVDHPGKNVLEKLKTEFKQIGKDQFRETEWLFTMEKKTQLVTYRDSGNVIRKEEVRIDTADGKTKSTTLILTAKYDGQRLLEETWVTRSGEAIGSSSSIFFYSPTKQLDSIVTDFVGSLNKECSINNIHGDPVEEYSVSNGDTTYHFIRTYIYDEKNNWIRMLQYRLPDKYWPLKGIDNSSPNTLYIRKISY